MKSTNDRTAKASIVFVLLLALAIALVPQPTSAQLLTLTLYEEDFEADDGGWTTSGTTPGWEWGAPTPQPVPLPGMTNVWGTNLHGNFERNACTFVQSPSISLPPVGDPLGIVEGLATIELTFQFWHLMEDQAWDAAALSLSTDEGLSWEWLYAPTYSPVWVNNPAHSCLGLPGQPQFHGNIAWTGYHYANQWTLNDVDLTDFAGEEIILRFGLGADFSLVTRGAYFDQVRIDLHLL